MESEDKIQQSIYVWFNNNYCLPKHKPRSIIFSVPNGGLRNKIEAIKLKSTGTLAGVSDLILIHLGEVIFIEVKTDIGKQSPVQLEFENRVKQQGFEYYLVRSLNEFKDIINNAPKKND